MLRDDRGDGGRRRPAARNVLGEALEICSIKPTTGFYRDGCCNTGREDIGSHTVCVVITSARFHDCWLSCRSASARRRHGARDLWELDHSHARSTAKRLKSASEQYVRAPS